MYDTHSRNVSYTAGFFMLIAFTIASLKLVGELTGPLWTAMTGKSVEVLKSGAWEPADSTALKLIHVITVLVGFFAPTVITASLLNRRPMKLLGFSPVRGGQAGLVLLIIGASLAFSTSLSYFNQHIPLPQSWKILFDEWENTYNRQVEAVINLRNGTDYIIALVIMAFLPALCEEIVFRGGLQNFLSRGTKKPWLSIVLVSLLFSLVHFSFYGFLYRFFLGVVLGALFHYSGKLWLSILGHFINNVVALTLVYIYVNQGKPLQDAMKTEASGYWGILALPVVIGLFLLFKKASVSRQPA
jgi:uncharacterized protein